MTDGTRSSFCAAALKLPVFATATKARIVAIVSILHDSRKLNRRQEPFSVGPARLGSAQCGHQKSRRVRRMIMKDKYDVLVVGGGAAGVGAAVGAAKTGARVGLLEAAACLGGAGTMRNVLTYCGLYTLGEQPRQAVAGVADEIMAKLPRWGAVTPPTRHRGVFAIFDPQAAKRAPSHPCAPAGVEILLHAFVFGADREDNAVARLRFADHSGQHQLEAREFVDASGDCDLGFFAGASTRYDNNAAR